MSTVHIPNTTADSLLTARGWRVVVKVDDGVHYVRPGRKSRHEGGKFGTDWLWERDEALTEALTNEKPAEADEPTPLAPGEHIDIAVDGHKVRIAVEQDASMGVYVGLGGLDCHLEGMEPGIYYLRPMDDDDAAAPSQDAPAAAPAPQSHDVPDRDGIVGKFAALPWGHVAADDEPTLFDTEDAAAEHAAKLIATLPDKPNHRTHAASKFVAVVEFTEGDWTWCPYGWIDDRGAYQSGTFEESLYLWPAS